MLIRAKYACVIGDRRDYVETTAISIKMLKHRGTVESLFLEGGQHLHKISDSLSHAIEICIDNVYGCLRSANRETRTG